MAKKSFYEDPERICILPKTLISLTNFNPWNREIPKHVKYFNESNEERNAITYLALLVEVELYRILPMFFSDFEPRDFNSAIRLIKSVKLIPHQILEAANNIRKIRNAITHDIKIVSLEDLKGTKPELISTMKRITNSYQGDYDNYYTKIEDTLRNRFKATCMNVISAFRYFEPSIKAVRNLLDNHEFEQLIPKEDETSGFPEPDGF